MQASITVVAEVVDTSVVGEGVIPLARVVLAIVRVVFVSIPLTLPLQLLRMD